MTVDMKEIKLPDYDVPREVPELGPEIYRARFQQLEKVRKEQGYDWILIYADREHSANLAWLTGFDPRFEEALWIQGSSQVPTLIAGNECYPFARAHLQIDAQTVLYQHFSLQDQPRSKSTDLKSLLKEAGLTRGHRCGMIGWKASAMCEVPHWIVVAIEEAIGGHVTNAASLLTAPPDGLRLRLEPEMVLFAEYGARITSDALKSWVRNLREGVSERDSAAYLQSYGLELSCHPMVNFGARIPSGLKSPRNAVARRGEYAQCAFGVIGALTCRAGRLADRKTPDADDYLELITNYLIVVKTWYEAMKVGAKAGDVVAAAGAVKNDEWEFALNPGHLLHLDEWVASPFSNGSQIPLRSGNAIQQDVIPVPARGSAVANIEDGFVLADEDLRNQLSRLDVKFMERCSRRRTVMESLGYNLSDDVLPLSNIAGVYVPYLFDSSVAVFFR